MNQSPSFDAVNMSQSNSKQNFKTFSLLRQQENLINQFEGNLQKTMDLLHKRQTHRPIQGSTSNYQYESGNYSMSRTRAQETNADAAEAGAYSALNQKSTSDYRIIALENENKSLRAQIKDLENENEILKSSLNTITLTNQRMSERHPIVRIANEQTELDRSKILELDQQNETLKQDIIKIKTEAIKKYEQLQKDNDSLLQAYEERFKKSMKNVTQKFENEITELKQQLLAAQNENQKLEEQKRQLRERMETTVLELEREKKDLAYQLQMAMKMKEQNLSTIYSPTNSQLRDASNFIVDQILKDKIALERKYDELFSSYNDLLQHNKVLASQCSKNSVRFDLPMAKRQSEEKRPKTSPYNSLNKASPSKELYETADGGKKYEEVYLERKYGRESSEKKMKRKRNADSVNASVNISAEEGRGKFSDSRLPDASYSILKPKHNQITMDDLQTDEEYEKRSRDKINRKVKKSASERNLRGSTSRKSSSATRSRKSSKQSSSTKRLSLDEKENLQENLGSLRQSVSDRRSHRRRSVDELVSKKIGPLYQEIKEKARLPKGSNHIQEPHATFGGNQSQGMKTASTKKIKNDSLQSSKPSSASSQKIPIYSKVTRY